MNDRRLLALLELAKNGATEGERTAARNALRDYIGSNHESLAVTTPSVTTPSGRALARQSVPWARPMLKLGLFMAVGCVLAGAGTSVFWTLVIAAVCAKVWDP